MKQTVSFTQNMTNRLRKNISLITRMTIWVSIVVFLAVQSLSAYGMSCQMFPKGGAVAPQESMGKQNAEVPPCHGKLTDSTVSKSMSKPVNDSSSINFCGDYCGCVKGGCSTIALVCQQLSSSFLLTQDTLPSLSIALLPSSLPQTPFRPPIIA